MPIRRSSRSPDQDGRHQPESPAGSVLRADESLVELVFAAQASPEAEPVATEAHRHPRFVRLSDLQHLRLHPPLAAYLRGMSPHRLSGAAYVGHLWRQEAGPEPRKGLT